MLVLSRKLGERIVIDRDIEVIVLESRGDKVRLGIIAPREVTIHREEIFRRIQAENTLTETFGQCPRSKATRTKGKLIRSWEPCVGERLPVVGCIHGNVLKLGPSDVTFGFVGTNSSEFASWASRQRRCRCFLCSAEGPTPMLIMYCRTGQRIEFDDDLELRIEQGNNSALKLSLIHRGYDETESCSPLNTLPQSRAVSR